MENSDFSNLLNRALASNTPRDADNKPPTAKGLREYAGLATGTLSDWRTGKTAARPFSTQVDDVIAYFELEPAEGAKFHYAAMEWWLTENRKVLTDTEDRRVVTRVEEPSDSLRQAVAMLNARLGGRLPVNLGAGSPREGRLAVTGTRNVMRFISELLRTAAEEKPPFVLVSFQSGPPLWLFANYPDEAREIRKRATEVRRAGVDIHSLWHRADNALDQFNAIHCLLGLEDTGGDDDGVHAMGVLQFEEQLLPSQVVDLSEWVTTADPVHDLLVTPNEALIMLARSPQEEPDSALYIYDHRQVVLLARHFEAIHSRSAVLIPSPIDTNEFGDFRAPPLINRIGLHDHLYTLPHPEAGYKVRKAMRGKRDLLVTAAEKLNTEAFYEGLHVGGRFTDVVLERQFLGLSKALKNPDDVYQRQTMVQMIENLIVLVTEHQDQYELVIIPENWSRLPIYPHNSCFFYSGDGSDDARLTVRVGWHNFEQWGAAVNIAASKDLLERWKHWVLGFRDLPMGRPAALEFLRAQLKALRR